MRRGSEVGNLARHRYPGGRLLPIDPRAQDALVRETLGAMECEDILYEPTFLAGDLLVRVDILVRHGEGWRIVEVKSGTSPKEEYVLDVAFQSYVLRQAGVNVLGCAVMHLNSDYVYQGGDHDLDLLFVEADVTDQAEACLIDLAAKIESVRPSLQPDGISPPIWKSDCKSCDAFRRCYDDPEPDHVFYLPSIRTAKLRDLLSDGIYRMADLDDAAVVPSWRPAVTAARSGQGWNSPDLTKDLSRLRYPLCFLDFEFVQETLPTVVGTRPYQSLVVQWSCHRQIAPDAPLTHDEWLHDGVGDPRPQAVATMLRALAGAGSIVVYSNAENTQINKLAEEGIDRADEVQKLFSATCFDLEKVVKKHTYRFGYYGGSRLKNVLPSLCPGFSYSDLEIREGNALQAAYFRAVDPATPADERGALRLNMLAYCQRDTEALVHVLRALREIR
jgi:hypothetical protein